MTTTTTTAVTALHAAGGPRGGLRASTRAELLNLRRWPATWVIGGAWLVLAVMFGYVFNYVAYTSGESTFSNRGESPDSLLAEMLPAAVPDVLVQGMPMFGGALVMVLGALAGGSGFGWGTWKTVSGQARSRLTAVAGSLIALALAVVLLVAAVLLLFVVASTVVAVAQDQPLVWPSLRELLESVGAGLLVLLMWAMAGFTLGVLTRGTALAAGLGLVWTLVVENLLRGVGSMISQVEAVTHVLPGTAGGSLIGAVADSVSEPPPGVLDVLGGPQALATVAVWTAALPLISCWVMRRRDLT